MATPKQISTTLLTEHLRYTPLTLLDDIINTVNELVARAVDAAEEGLLAADPAALGFHKRYEAEGRIADTDAEGKAVYPELRPEVEEGCHRLETLLESNVDRNFDKLEIYVLRNVLSVPGEIVPWVRLGHYEGVKFPPPGTSSGGNGEEGIQGIQRLRRKVQETKKLQSALNAQIKRNEVLLQQLRALMVPPTGMKTEHLDSPDIKTAGKDDANGAYSFLTHTTSAQALGIAPLPTTTTPKAPQANPLSTNTSFTLSQLPALKALLADLRPKLSNTSFRASESEAAWERRLYLETQTRRVLERRGIAIGENGSGGEGVGRRVGSEELAALEGIVEGLDK